MRLQSYLERRLDVLRQQNDGDLDPIGTARLRGKVSMVKELLDLATPSPAQRDTDA